MTYPAQTDGARLADGLAAFLDAMGIERASLAGTSLGAYVAQFISTISRSCGLAPFGPEIAT